MSDGFASIAAPGFDPGVRPAWDAASARLAATAV
jgi:hypothetical protein